MFPARSAYIGRVETPRRPARRDQQRNRQALLRAAREEFRQRGIDAPLDAIARRAGVSNATLYRHFPQRRDLVAEILIGNLERSAAELAVAESSPSAWDGLVGYLTWHFAAQVDDPAYMSGLRAVPAGENEQVDRLRNGTNEALRVLVERAKAEGALRADRWIEDIYLALALNETLGRTGFADPHQASRRFLELTLTSLAARPSPADDSGEPDTVLSLRRTLGRQLAGLP